MGPHCGSNALDTMIRPEVPPINTKISRCVTDGKDDEMPISTTSYSQSPSNKLAQPSSLAISGVRPSYQTNTNPASTPLNRPSTAPMSPNTINDPAYYQQGGMYQGGDMMQGMPNYHYRSNTQPQQVQGQVSERGTSSLGGGNPLPVTRSQSPYSTTSVYQSVTPGTQSSYHTVYNRTQPSSTHFGGGQIFGLGTNANYGQSNAYGPGGSASYALTPSYNQGGDSANYVQRHSGEQQFGGSSMMVGQGGAQNQFTPTGQLFGQGSASYNNYPPHYFNPNTGGSYGGNAGQYSYSSNAGTGSQQGGPGSQQRRHSPPGGRNSYDSRM